MSTAISQPDERIDLLASADLKILLSRTASYRGMPNGVGHTSRRPPEPAERGVPAQGTMHLALADPSDPVYLDALQKEVELE
jgi:hypothetical protein